MFISGCVKLPHPLDFDPLDADANAAARGAQYASQAGNALVQAVMARADAGQLLANAKYARRAGVLQMVGGLLSASGNFLGETARNWGP